MLAIIEQTQKFIIPFILLVASTLLLKPNFVTFFRSSSFEKRIISKEIEVLYKTFIYIFLFIILPVLLTNSNYDEIIEFLNKYELRKPMTYLVGFFFAISLISYFLAKKYHHIYISLLKRCQKINDGRIKKGKSKYKNKRIILISILIYSIIFVNLILALLSIIVIGLAHSEILVLGMAEPDKYFFNLPNIIIVSLFFLPLFSIYNYILTPFIRIKVKLSNGETINGGYFLHTTFGNQIVIGDNPFLSKCKQTLIIKKNEIIYYETEESFDKYAVEINSKIEFTS